MSKLNLNRNIFLEKEELVRNQEFLINDTIASIFLDNTTKWGIVRTDFVTDPNPDFKIEVGTNIGTVKIANLSKAVDSDRLLIYQEAIDNISITNDGLYYWVKISHQYRRYEVGDVTINTSGQLSGVGTLFSEVIRGQQTNVPVKIKFFKEGGTVNNQIYEVVDITDDLNVILNGDFVNETDLKYIVIGSTVLGESLTASQEEGLYKYDDCLIELVAETVTDTPPTVGYTAEKDFYLARVVNNSGTVTIEDKRTEYWTFNVEGTSDKLDKSNNLSDVANASTSRVNLSVYSKTEVDTLVAVNNTGYKAMTPGVAASATGFDIVISRLGKVVSVFGKFVGGGNTSDNAIVASINLSELSGLGSPPRRVIFATHSIVSADSNRGIAMYIDPVVSPSVTLKIKVLRTHDATGIDFEFNATYIIN